MIDRRALALSLLPLMLATAGLSACAGGDGPPRGGPGGPGGRMAEDEPEMLFISPMGEPFRAKPPAPYPVDVWFKQADTDHDGKLDLAEFLADAERFFHVLDVNHDGLIDHREIFYYEHVTVPEMIGQSSGMLRLGRDQPKLWLAQFGGGGPGSGRPSGPPEAGNEPMHVPKADAPLIGAAAFGLLADPEPVQGSDIRLSGTISLNDFKTRAQQRFDILDFDHKGYLTLAGLPETEAQKNTPHHGGFQRGLRRPAPTT